MGPKICFWTISRGIYDASKNCCNSNLESGAHLLQIYCMIALDSQIANSPSFKVGTQWAGLIAKNSGLFCSPANKSKSVNLKSTLANLNVASQARAKNGMSHKSLFYDSHKG